MEVELKLMRGTHITPLTQNIVLEPPDLLNTGLVATLDVLKPLRTEARDNFLETVREVQNEILSFLDRSVGVSKSPLSTDPLS